MSVEVLWSKGFGLVGSTHILTGTTIPASEVLKKLLIGRVKRIVMNVRVSGNSQKDDLIEIVNNFARRIYVKGSEKYKKVVERIQLKTLKKTVLSECYTN